MTLPNPFVESVGTLLIHPLRALWREGVNLLFPPRCVSCHTWGEWLCARCLAEIPYLAPPLCPRCSRPLRQPGLCNGCRRESPPFDSIHAVASYNGSLRAAIIELKYGSVQAVAEPLSDLLWRHWQQAPLPATLVVPVPAHPHRLKERGYNQATLLAKPLAQRASLPLAEKALSRTRHTEKQVLLTGAQRWDNVSAAFVADASQVSGEAVLLVDDICTTTATLTHCTIALRRAGARAVWGLVLARACAPAANREATLPDHPAAPPTIDNYRE